MRLSILICTISKRKNEFALLYTELRKQCNYVNAEILFNSSDTMTIGAKRNDLLQRATGDYVCFIDDDDTVDKNYISRIIEALKGNPDCLDLRGSYTKDGIKQKPFVHSIKYKYYDETEDYYMRPPNHLNVIRASIAKKFVFPETNFGEDTDWAMQIAKSGLLKHENILPGIMYHYRYKSNK
jgi:glycosyltransferase involved in cell wall biosynthesis